MNNKLLKALVFTPMEGRFWGAPAYLWGLPGIAKSATFKALGKSLGWRVEILSPSERGEGAFGVVPVPDKVGAKTVLTYPAPDWVAEMEALGEGLVIVEEIGSCPPALQPALLGLVQDRRIGGHVLSPRIRVMGAGNPVNVAAGGQDLAPPVANRGGHFDCTPPPAEKWIEWLLGAAQTEEVAAFDATAEEARVMARWPEVFGTCAARVAGFIKRSPSLLHVMPPEGNPAASRAWPSHRTWEYATRVYASGVVQGLTPSDQEALMAAFIGTGPAGEFWTWLNAADLPDPAELLDGKVTFAHEGRRQDRTLVVLNSCAALVAPVAEAGKPANTRKDRAMALWKLIDEVSEVAPDLGIPAMRKLIEAKLQTVDGALKVMAKLAPTVTAAGMVKKAKGG